MTDAHEVADTAAASASPKLNGNGVTDAEPHTGSAAMTKSDEPTESENDTKSAPTLSTTIPDTPDVATKKLESDGAEVVASPVAASPTRSKGARKPVPSASSLELSDVPPPTAAQTIEREAGHDAPGTSPSRRPTLAAVDTSKSGEYSPESPSARHAPDSPTTSLIASLRQQLELVSDQATQLNAKLISSISRHADLEDQIFTLQDEKERTATTVQELEHAKAQWEESMNTGLLVERDQITLEMQRLAAGLVEEERKRGTAEERRAQVENEVDDLAASLFDQANTMVAAERMSRAQAEERLKASQENLAVAEAAVRDMQLHLQTLSASSETPSNSVTRMPLPRRILSSHPPYAEFISFLQHLRAARPRTARARDLYPAPTVSTMLAQPFLSRCIQEDHEPTLRLDAAPDLGWVSRRSVGSAIIAGDLIIEPVGVAALGPVETVSCALCGRHVYGINQANQSRFSLNKIFSSPTTASNAKAQSTVYVFRTTGEGEKLYPLCRNGWCLERLRAACALWHFIRTGIVGPVWSMDDVQHSRQVSSASTTPTVTTSASASGGGTASTATGDSDSAHATPTHSIAAPSPARSAHSVQGATPSPSPSPAQPEPRRKSAWGIGGWGSWGSRPSTPSNAEEEPEPSSTPTPVHVVHAPAPVPLASPVDLKHQPSAPSPLAKSVEPVSPVTEKEASPDAEKEVVEVLVTGAEETVDEKTGAEAAAHPEIKVEDKSEDKVEELVDDKADGKARSESRASHSDSESFRTPEATPVLAATDLKDAVAADAVEDVADKKESSEPETKADSLETEIKAAALSASTASSAAPTSTPSPTPRPPARSANRGAAPPLPKRAAARGPVSPPATPPRVSLSKDEEKNDEKKEDEKKEDEEKEDKEKKEDEEKKKEDEEVEAEDAKTEDVKEAKEETKDAEAEQEAKVEEEIKDEQVKEIDVVVAEAATESKADGAEEGVSEKAIAAEDADADVAPRTSTDAAQAEPTSEKAPSKPIPPPLPPRHGSAPTSPLTRASASGPRTPVSAPLGSLRAAQNTQAHDDEQPDKTFATGDSWEVRTWRQVISLKEDMWRTRVGVIDDES